MSLPAVALVPAVAVMAVLSACSGGSSGSDASASVVRGLCLAAGQAPTSPVQARATFAEAAHDQIHELADAVSEVDRPLAASLLEAKARVESGLADPAAGQLDVDLGQLARVAAEAYEVVGLDPADGLEGCR